jgi:hypothetical protein
MAAVLGEGLTAQALGNGVIAIEPAFPDISSLDGFMLP